MNDVLYLFTFLGILIGITYILYRIHIPPLFYLTHFSIANIYLSISIWEASVRQPTTMGYVFSLWIITIGFVVTIPLLIYSTYRYENTFSLKEGAVLGLLILGCILLYGVLEDLCCFVIWGFEYFTPAYVTWHFWIGDFMPWWYLTGIPGVPIIIYAFYWSRKNGWITTKTETRVMLHSK